MLRRTKIIATLGPATDDPEILSDMIEKGIDVVRINFSHDTASDHKNRVAMVRKIAQQCGRDIGIIGDLQGPKIRIKTFDKGKVELNKGEQFFLDTKLNELEGDKKGVGVDYENFHMDVVAGDTLLLSDGRIKLKVEKIRKTRIFTSVIEGGILYDNQGMNRKGGGLSTPAITKKDIQDIKLAAQLEIDFLAISFIRSAQDIENVRQHYHDAGGNGLIVSKIERREAVECIDSIIDASDVIMVARGDLGVEVGFTELTGIQKQIIRKTRYKNKVVITATQMMESMIHNSVPTRAEVSDVSNAVMDGTDAVMLSAETAIGKNPVLVVGATNDICYGAEKYTLPRGRTAHRLDDQFEHIDESIAMAVMYTANHLAVRAIISLTESGSTALWMSRIRSDIPIYAFTPHVSSSRRVTLYRGVYPVSFKYDTDDIKSLYKNIFSILLDKQLVEENDLVIFTKGEMKGISGGTNSMRIIRVTA